MPISSNGNDPLGLAIDGALTALTDPELSAEARVRRILIEVANANYPNAQRRAAAADEIRRFGTIVKQSRLSGDHRTLLEEAGKLHTKCVTELSRPIPEPTHAEKWTAVYARLNAAGWPSSEVDLLVEICERSGEIPTHTGPREVRVVNKGGVERIITREMVRELGRPVSADPEVWRRNFSNIPALGDELSKRRSES